MLYERKSSSVWLKISLAKIRQLYRITSVNCVYDQIPEKSLANNIQKLHIYNKKKAQKETQTDF